MRRLFIYTSIIISRTDYKKDQDNKCLNFREVGYNVYGMKKLAEMVVIICIYEKL